MSIFHERLRALKDGSGKTQSAIAADLGISYQAFSYYINGREPSYDLLVQIANYFGTTTDYLLGRSDMPTFGMEYIHKTTGLDDRSIQALVLLKESLAGWNKQKENEFHARLVEAIGIIADSDGSIGIEEDDNLITIFNVWYASHDKVPDYLNNRILKLREARAKFEYAYRALRVLNCIIRATRNAKETGAILYSLDSLIFPQEIKTYHETYLNTKTYKEGISFDDYLLSIRAISERKLIERLYDLSQEKEDIIKTEIDEVFEILDPNKSLGIDQTI